MPGSLGWEMPELGLNRGASSLVSQEPFLCSLSPLANKVFPEPLVTKRWAEGASSFPLSKGLSRSPSPGNLPFTLQIGPSRFRAPELLFRPDLIGEESEGIHEVLVFAIQKSDMDLRRTLFSNIVLSGGSTLFKGWSLLLGPFPWKLPDPVTPGCPEDSFEILLSCPFRFW